MKREPLAGTHAVEDHVGWDFEKHDTERKHLLSDIELILGDLEILEEVVGECVRDVTTIEFCSTITVSPVISSMYI